MKMAKEKEKSDSIKLEALENTKNIKEEKEQQQNEERKVYRRRVLWRA